MRALKSILVSLIVLSGTLPCLAWGGPQHQNDSKNNRQQYHLNGPGPHKGDWLRKNGNLPESQQEQKLRQDPRFQNLSPDQQQRLLDRLQRFNNLPPDQKAQVLNRMETFEHLSPQQQQQARGLFQQYKELPENRRGKVSEAYRQLRDLPPDQRNQLLNSEEYRGQFSDSELNLLRGMTALGPQNR